MTDRSLFYNLGAVLACFLCFFIIQKPRAENFERLSIPVESNADKLLSISGALVEINADSNLEVMFEKNSIRLRMYTDNMFRISRAELSRDAQAVIRALFMRIRNYNPSHIHIEGHTSDDPTNTPQYPNNWYLSSARAIAVGMFLINELGMDTKRVTAQGYGALIPLDKLDKSKNSRIEIIVTP